MSANLQGTGAEYRRAAPEYDEHAHIEKGMDAAIRCVAWLKAEGFTVLEVHVGGGFGRPLINIQTGPECTRLVVELGACTNGWSESGRRMNAIIMGCRVVWLEKGH